MHLSKKINIAKVGKNSPELEKIQPGNKKCKSRENEEALKSGRKEFKKAKLLLQNLNLSLETMPFPKQKIQAKLKNQF